MNNPRQASSVPAEGQGPFTDEEPAETHRFVDDYLPALLAQASQLIFSEFH